MEGTPVPVAVVARAAPYLSSMPRTSPLRAVLFDLDGTLFDSIALLLASMRHAFEEFDGAKPVESEWIAGIGTPLITQLGDFARSDAELLTLRDRYRTFQQEHHFKLARIFPGALGTLQTLKDRGVAMALVTSKGNALAQEALDVTGMTPFVPVLVGADSCTRHKPHPEPVLLALSLLGVAAADAVFVGDSPHDVNAGNAAGVITVAATWGAFSRAQLEVAKPAFWLDDISALPELLATM